MVGLELVLPLAAALATIPALIAHVKDQRHRCPHCAEPIRAEALVCPHCRRDLATSGLSATA